jgi:outer membrane protein OmpA-like peptidoglycan-associated protein
MRLFALRISAFFLGISLAAAEGEGPGLLPATATRSESTISDSVSSISESVTNLQDATQAIEQSNQALSDDDSSQGEPIEGILITETEKEVTIDLSSDILFDFNKWSIRPDASKALTAVETILSKHPKADINLEGHTDSVGSDQYNKDLSMKRALSVREWFIENSDIPARRFKPIGLGEARPVAPNAHPDGSDNPEGRQKNRRVTIVVQK